MLEEYQEWEEGEMLFCRYPDPGEPEFISTKEGREKNVQSNWFKNVDMLDREAYLNGEKSLIDLDFDSCEIREMYATIDEFDSTSELETFYTNYTTPKGESIVAFGEYGYDG